MNTPFEKKSNHTSRDGLRVIFRYAMMHKRLFYTSMFSMILIALFESARPYFVGLFVGEITKIENLSVLSQDTWLYLGILVGLGIIMAVCRLINGLSVTKLVAKIIVDYRISSVKALLSYPISFFKTKKSGEIHEVVSRTEKSLSDFIAFHATGFLIEIMKLLFSFGFIFFISWKLGIILFIGLSLFALQTSFITNKIRIASKNFNEALNDIKNNYFEAISNIFEIKRAATEDEEVKKISNDYGGRFVDLWYREDSLWVKSSFFNRIILAITYLFLYGAGAVLVLHGELGTAAIVSIILYVGLVFGPIKRISDSWIHLQKSLIKVQEGEELMSHPAEEDGLSNSEVSYGEIEFRNTTFSYDEGEALKNISFKVPAGSTVALVGESGAGKTTTIELMGGYYLPQEGQVLVDGVSTADYERHTLRSALGYVSQEVTLFNDTIAKNIAYGASNKVNEKAIEDAAKAAGIHAYIQGLEDGYETNVGERGLRLSVGQKQRIAIARAFLRNPKILILDEPTSALDARTERHVTDSLKKLMKDRTTVIIAHRLSTTRDADLILVFKKGEIVERGTHEELLSMKGEYAHMYQEHVGLH